MFAILSISAYAIALALCFAGIGLGFKRLFTPSSIDQDDVLTAFWVGFAIAVCFLQIWHLFFAVTGRALAIVSLASAATWYWRLPAVSDWWRRLPRRSIVIGCLISLVVLLWIADNAAGSGNAWDSALYHIQTVRWNRSYPVVPGLANLNDRLAFNSSSLLYAAMLEWGPWTGRSNHIAHAVLMWVLFLQIVLSGYRLMRAGKYPAGFFDLVLLAPAISIAISIGISSLLTDVPVGIVIFVACSRLYRLLTAEEVTTYDTLSVVILAALSICLKASAIIVAPLLVAAALIRKREAIKWSAIAVACLIVPWMVHGSILSGYPLYPSTVGALPVDWRSPAQLANATRLWITISARNVRFSQIMTALGFEWIPGWIRGLTRWGSTAHAWQWGTGIFGVLIPLSITGLSVPLGKERRDNRAWLLPGVLAIAAAIWFYTGPSPRFGFTIFWSFAAAAVAIAGSNLAGVRPVAVGVAFCMAGAAIILPVPRHNIPWAIVRRIVVRPGADHGFTPYEKSDTYAYRTDSGLVLNVPKGADTCYDAPLPCTPYPAPNLLLAHAWDGRPKFITNGQWRQIHWPNMRISDKQVKAFMSILSLNGEGPK
ncbi:MAG: hypothetical protein JO307_24190 [Bryobacterales bacterium]|nr:hypothetical protein [Bryobacterales bacterium]MBV9397310.1 hypothetical protein [Bryobacterales bacterium]